MAEQGKRTLDQAYDELEETPDAVSPVIRWLRKPEARWIRWPAGIALIVAGFFGFLRSRAAPLRLVERASGAGPVNGER